MSSYYYGPKRTRGLFDPESSEPFKISRSKIDFFFECPRCFYLDRRLGVSRPSMPSFSLNIAVDHLLKKEFDTHRFKKSTHPLMKSYGIDAVPFEHPEMDTWRENFVGVQYLHKPTNFIVFGAVDDIWVNPKGELHVVDYKATSKAEAPTLEGRWGEQYQRQMEVYQWLLRRNGFTVSDTGYFVYVNGKTDRAAFDGKLEFDVKLIPYKGSDAWIEEALLKIKKTLESDNIPPSGEDCDYCRYMEASNETDAYTN